MLSRPFLIKANRDRFSEELGFIFLEDELTQSRHELKPLASCLFLWHQGVS